MSAVSTPPAAPYAESRDPATGKQVATYPFTSDAELETLLEKSSTAQSSWCLRTPAERAAVLRSMARVLRDRMEALAAEATTEMGKTRHEARAEVEKCAALCDWYAEHGPRWLGDESTSVEGAYVSYLPLGVVIAVMPWNFPYWQAMRAAVPILLGGNGYLLKPAETVIGCARLLQQAWQDAGLPEGVFLAANLSRNQTSQAIADDRIAAVTVTGSVAAGRALATQAAQHLKKSVLELGGSDPFIVLADADIETAAATAVAARFQNAGQVCIAAKRIIVEAPAYPSFVEAFVRKARELVVGPGHDEGSQMGPMARLDLLEQLHTQVTASVHAGAELLLGGQRLQREGFFYAPTVLGKVTPAMTVFKEETFGPVAAITEARDAEHALALANLSDYGLSGNLWTADVARARKMARQLMTGGVFINGYSASDPRVPIGGVKKSGYGRELSHFGLHEFVNAQTVWLDRR